MAPEDDQAVEADETVTVSGVSELAVTPAMLMLLDDDESDRPVLSVAGATGYESDGELIFAVTLDGAASGEVTVTYATGDGTAVSGADYETAQGVLTFAPGEARRTLAISLLDDDVREPEESFSLHLSSPENATLAVDSATGMIIDDDGAGKAPTKGRVLLFESTSNTGRQGFVRVINHSDVAGEVLVEAIDDSGMRSGPLTWTFGAGVARHFNSDDLEGGNADKGLLFGLGPPTAGSWRLELSSELDIEGGSTWGHPLREDLGIPTGPEEWMSLSRPPSPTPRAARERVGILLESLVQLSSPHCQRCGQFYVLLTLGALPMQRDRECLRILPASFEMQLKCQHSACSRNLAQRSFDTSPPGR